MPKKDAARNRLDTAVPNSSQMDRLSDGEKQALELEEQSLHSHGTQRERMQEAAKEAADDSKD